MANPTSAPNHDSPLPKCQIRVTTTPPTNSRARRPVMPIMLATQKTKMAGLRQSWRWMPARHACGRQRREVGSETLGGSCHGASDHGPLSFRRVGQSVDLPVEARRWGHDLRGSPHGGCLKSRSQPARPRRGRVLTSCSRPTLSRARVGAAARSGPKAGAARERSRERARRSGAQPGLDAGENIKALSLYLGHSDPGFTLRVYTHLMPSSETRTRKAISAMYRAAGHAHDGPETAQAA